jgi:DNA-binding GntR family transcriptional regulator
MNDHPSSFSRRNLSEDLASLIREMIFDGRLPAGERINEVHLAASLGVSRTPLREALAGLVAEAALTSVPRQGFFVRELTLEEARNIYPIRAYLDPEALRLSGIPSPERLERLETINEELRATDSVASAIHLDESWHREVWADCPNPELIALIEQFMRRTRRYELASMRQPRIIRSTTESKARVVEALRDRSLTRACSILRKSLIKGGTPVFEWLVEREKSQSEETPR